MLRKLKYELTEKTRNFRQATN